MRVASLDGTPTVTLIDTANTTSGDWSADGWIYVEGGRGVLRIRPTKAVCFKEAAEPAFADYQRQIVANAAEARDGADASGSAWSAAAPTTT